MRRRVPPKSLGGREEVSLSPRAVLAPDLPPSVLWNRRSLRNSFVHHLPGCSIFAAFHTRSYTGYVPIMLSMKLSKCKEGPKEERSLQCVGIGKGHLLSAFQIFFYFFELLSNSTSGTIPKMSHIRLPVSVHKQ